MKSVNVLILSERKRKLKKTYYLILFVQFTTRSSSSSSRPRPMAEDPTATPPTLARTTAPNTDHTRHPLCRISQTLTWLYKQTSMFPICTLLLALSRVLVLLIPSVSCLYCAILNFVPIRFSVSALSRRDISAGFGTLF